MEAFEVVAAELVDDDDNDEFGLAGVDLCRPGDGEEREDEGQKQEDENARLRLSIRGHTRHDIDATLVALLNMV
jgi:hypothetical protein